MVGKDDAKIIIEQVCFVVHNNCETEEQTVHAKFRNRETFINRN